MLSLHMLKLSKIAVCLLVLLLPLVASAQPSEQILSYHSDIEVLKDSSLLVTETIQVVSTGDQIRRGIYRDFPIVYQDNLGRRYSVNFELLEVQRDDKPEPHLIERAGNGLRIYIGQEDVFIPPGEYEYTIKYKTTRQLGFFENHDELYWNVTGTGWTFPIKSAAATVKLPSDTPKEEITAQLYTGVQGSTERNGTYRINDDKTVEFITNEDLAPYEGLTVVVGWPKGIVTPPSAGENFLAGIKDNFDIILGALWLLIVLGFYLLMWHKRGRDAKTGTIIAQYEPPQKMSPAFIRFIQRMGPDNSGFAAAIINMGLKGRLTISEKEKFLAKDTYTLTEQKNSLKAALSEEEEILAKEFFSGRNSIDLEKKNAIEISKIRQKFWDSLKTQAGKKYFARNTWVMVLGVLMSVFLFVSTIVSAVYISFGSIPASHGLFIAALFLSLLFVNIIFGFLLPAYTAAGRKLADEIAGFKLFLTVTEKDRLAFHNPPERTPELFEKMLPYALALGVEHQWAEQFAATFAKLRDAGVKYSPLWYHGVIGSFTPSAFASSIGSSFAGVVASSSTPPGSSSGSSGGSSGGGGGGGGGGGW